MSDKSLVGINYAVDLQRRRVMQLEDENLSLRATVAQEWAKIERAAEILKARDGEDIDAAAHRFARAASAVGDAWEREQGRAAALLERVARLEGALKGVRVCLGDYPCETDSGHVALIGDIDEALAEDHAQRGGEGR